MKPNKKASSALIFKYIHSTNFLNQMDFLYGVNLIDKDLPINEKA